MTTLQEQNLLDAALAYEENKNPNRMQDLLAAVSAYRATQVKECRPPNGAKAGSWWWLVNHSYSEPMIEPVRWDGTGWSRGNFSDSPKSVQHEGWTVHSECRFGETGVEATPDAIWKWIVARMPAALREVSVAHANTVEAAFLHFRAPKLEISDEEIDDLFIRWSYEISGSGLRRSVSRRRRVSANNAVTLEGAT